ncbi:MAG TPA: MFS transporter [Candidatus Binatia bacterium]|nr:MFS transporter [Candidatus Binatia bacterium]
MAPWLRLTPTVRGLITLYASTLLSGMWSMLVPSIPVMATHFGISPGTAAQVVTALAFGRLAGMPISGVVLDRLGTRTALVAGPGLACAVALLAAIVPWFSIILLLLFVLGIAESIWVIAREVAGIDLALPNQRGRVLSGFHGVNYMGLALGPLAGGLLAETSGFRGAFIVYAACAAISVLLGFMVNNSRTPHSVQATAPAGGRSITAWLQRLRNVRKLVDQIPPHFRATYVVVVFATFTSFIHRVTTQSMLPLFATTELGLSPKQVGLLFTISGVAAFVMILPAGFVIDKVGRKWATVPSTGIPALAFLLIPFAGNFSQLALLMLFLGIANGLSLGSLATSTFDVIPVNARGRLQALRRTIAEIGGVGAPLAGGILADNFNPGVPFLVYAPLIILSAVLLAFIARETLQR